MLSDQNQNMSPREYRPVGCDIHDKLESLATLHQPAEITYTGPQGVEHRSCGHIEDVYTEGKAEYLRLDDGEVIRLDWITSVDGRSEEQRSCG